MWNWKWRCSRRWTLKEKVYRYSWLLAWLVTFARSITDILIAQPNERNFIAIRYVREDKVKEAEEFLSIPGWNLIALEERKDKRTFPLANYKVEMVSSINNTKLNPGFYSGKWCQFHAEYIERLIIKFSLEFIIIHTIFFIINELMKIIRFLLYLYNEI